MYGNCERASCEAIRYTGDLEESVIVSGVFGVVCASAAVVDGDDGDDEVLAVVVVVGEVLVASRYRKVCGINAWYCARRAKTAAVGPEGR